MYSCIMDIKFKKIFACLCITNKTLGFGWKQPYALTAMPGEHTLYHTIPYFCVCLQFLTSKFA